MSLTAETARRRAFVELGASGFAVLRRDKTAGHAKSAKEILSNFLGHQILLITTGVDGAKGSPNFLP